MNAFVRHLRFQPHGDNLLTQSAGFWLVSVRVLVFSMALAEAVSWGYLGFLFGEGPWRWLSAAGVAAVIFLCVWMVDLSLITLDRAWGEHSAKLLDGKPEAANRRGVRDLFTITLRIALLFGSVYITVPYLAQVVFHRDIEQFTTAEVTKAIDAARQQLVAKFDVAIAEKNQQIVMKRGQYEAETAGKGLSGRFGEGPAAKAMLSDAERLTAERNALVGERGRALDVFNRLSVDWRANREALAASYAVDLPKASILQNRKALEELRKRPENRQTELALKALMWFIFTGLLLLKLFEPSSVRLYMSEVLQQEYLRYKAGVFDRELPEGEKSMSGFKMSPQRLYSFLTTTWLPIQLNASEQAEEAKRRRDEERRRDDDRREREFAEEQRKWKTQRDQEDQEEEEGRRRRQAEEARKEEERRREEERAQWTYAREQRVREQEDEREQRERLWAEEQAGRQRQLSDRIESAQARIAAALAALDRLRTQRDTAARDVESAQQELGEVRTRAAREERSLTDLRATIAMVRSDIDYFDTELASAERQKHGLDEESARELTVIQARTRGKRGDAVESLKALTDSLPGEERKCGQAVAELAGAEKRAEAARRRVSELEDKMAELERQIAEENLRIGAAMLEADRAGGGRANDGTGARVNSGAARVP